MKQMAKLAQAELIKLVQLKNGAIQLPKKEEESLKAVLENKRVTYDEALDLIDILTRPLIFKYNELALSNDVTNRLLATKFGVTEEEFEKIEKEVQELNKEEMEKQAKAFQEKLQELQKEMAEEK